MRVVLAAVAVLWSAMASAEEPAPAPADLHRHVGFFFHMELGGGYLRSDDGSGALSGAAFPATLSFGGAFAENWILTTDLSGTVAFAASPYLSDSSIGLAGLGGSVRHYFMPANIFVSLGAAATLLAHDALSPGGPLVGFGLQLSVGKEWWVGERSGIGIAGRLLVSVNRDRPTPASPSSGVEFFPPVTWTTLGAGIVVSMSYH